MELDSHSRMDCLAAELSLHSCSLDTVRGQEEGGGAGLSQQDGLSRRRVAPQQLLLGHCGFVALFRTAVETAVSEVHELLGTDGVPTS